ncbi:39S ribosomal protein L38, mitochondrial [Batrachochytrium dendrobatidis]|nr:39S ribosomal protein L38, mitochondrial [Batrachochytrium dendrobatidis]KAK5669840.1 39S ribosomal protein L38, mitochondrial [Batrachochytrium dendrobatidis]
MMQCFSLKTLSMSRTISLTTIRSLSVSSTGTALDQAHLLASAFLDQERLQIQGRISNLTEQLKSVKGEAALDLELQIRRSKVEYDLSSIETHRLFNDGKVGKRSEQLGEDVFFTMINRRWRDYLRPKLLKSAQQWKLMKDVFPADFVPTLGLNINFPKSNWLAPFGQHVDPTKCLYSPEIIITRDFDTLNTDHYTLLMTDLDRPNLDTKSYEEWCHWLVTDIPVGRSAEFPGGVSPFFKPERLVNIDPLSKFAPIVEASRAKSDSQSESLIPGNVVFPYIPPHPTFSNPRRVHRYVVTLFKQPNKTTPLNIDMSKLQLQAETDRAQMANAQKDLPLSSRFHETEGEMALQMRERFLVAPTMKFAKDYNLELAGFGFITSSWVPETSHVFTGLNIHEPVYGKKYNQFPKTLALRLHASKEMMSELNKPIAQLTREEIKKLNAGKRPSFDRSRVITTGDVQLGLIQKVEAERAAKDSNEPTKQRKSKGIKNTEPVMTPVKKMPRLTEIAAAALVRNKPSDVASKIQGSITSEILNRRNRFENR